VGKDSNKRILAIRLSALGDVAMTVPVLLAVARLYPEVRFIFITKAHFAPVLQGVANLQVYPFDAKGTHKGLAGLWRLRSELKEENFECIADLHAVLRTQALKVLFSFSGKPFKSLHKGRKEKRQLTSGHQKFFEPLKSTFQRYAEVFKDLGYEAYPKAGDVLMRESWPGNFDDGFSQTGWIRIGVAPFAAHPGKCYPEKQMKSLIELLGEIPNLRLYLFGGGKRESELLGSWEEAYAHCVSVAGKIPLSEELSLISNLRLMVSMDSGNGHLAAMYGLPVVTIWGVTHPYAGFTPFNQPEENEILADREKFPAIPTSVYGNKAPEGYENAMATIAPGQIYKRILEILQSPESKMQI
jgi:ADP-heptose:LPS heptosyltransferase